MIRACAPALRAALLASAAMAGAVAIASSASADEENCDPLAAPGLFPETTVQSATFATADADTRTPAFCEVTAAVSPVEGSSIGVVYRLPETWNGKLLGIGGGGWMGNTRIESARDGLNRGYATLQTDGGHAAGPVFDTSWAVDADGGANMVAIEDFSHRAVHVMTDVGKAVSAAYYGEPHRYAYWQGCSTGGRQGLMEAQRYPGDYDGVIAGAPVYDLLTQTSGFVRNMNFSGAARSLSPGHPELIADAVHARCDAADGAEDGVIRDPRACTWDPAELACEAGDEGDQCLTTDQVDAVRVAYDGVLTSTGELAAYPLSRGSEAGWDRFVDTGDDDAASLGMNGLSAALFGDARFDMAAFDPETDVERARTSAMADHYEATDAQIDAFLAEGGKLILWHGFYDPGPSPLGTIRYYERVLAETDPANNAAQAVRLFLAPGVGHCRGGPGPDEFDALTALEAWIEDGVAPASIDATATDSDLSWPLCPYPALPRGSVDADGARTYRCE